jgi:hypothetical protein
VLPEPSHLPPTSDDDAALLSWLANHDVACPLCKYNLRGLTTARCPECGNAIRLGVTLADPYLRAWITLAAAVCTGAGVGVLLSYAIIRAGPSNLLGGAPRGIAFAIISFVAMVPVAIVVLLTRRRFQRLSRRIQWWISIAGLFLVLSAFVTFVIEAR